MVHEYSVFIAGFIPLSVPGYHVKGHCQESKETQCEPCDEGFFTEHENYIDNCLSCRLCHRGKLHHQIPANTEGLHH